jgi:hypothetical protein
MPGFREADVSCSARSHKGLSSAPVPISRTLTVALALALAATAPACSKKAERLVGNEILARGPGGLGDTAREASPLDRDTYLMISTADRSTALLAGILAPYEAQILLKVGAWSLPDTNDLTVVIDSVRLELTLDGEMSIPNILTLELRTAAAAWDTTTVEWPGPGFGTLLASGDPHDAVGAFKLELGSGAYPLVRSWATDPASLNGFVIRRVSGTEVAAFKAGACRFRIVYHHTGSSAQSFADTPVTTDLFIHTPLAPTATGADTTLILGGLYAPVVAFRAPMDSFTPGFSLDEARVVFRVRSDSPTFPDSVVVTVEARRIQNSWTEGAADTAGLGIATTFLDRVVGYQVRDASDTLLIVPIPTATVRDWSSGALANEGIVLRIGEAYRGKEIWLYSRESSKPPEFRISTTSPPPGRF